MKLVIVYQPQSEHARVVDDFVRDFSHLHPDINIQLMDADSAGSQTIINAYDIVQYPTIMAMSEDGKLQNMWRGSTFPQMDEIFGYLNT